jgi:hypothetical protein
MPCIRVGNGASGEVFERSQTEGNINRLTDKKGDEK